MMDKHEKEEDQAARCCKPWRTKRFKFGPFHLYRSAMYFAWEKYDPYTPTSDEWERKIKKLCPLQYYIREEFPYLFSIPAHRIKDKWYKFKCWLRPYNVIKIKTLPNTWTDNSEVMVHAIFAVLERYFNEAPEEIVSFDEEPQKTFWKEINEARQWWMLREYREKQIEKAQDIAHNMPKDLSYDEKYKVLISLEAQYEKEQEEMLQRLIKYRNFLWT